MRRLRAPRAPDDAGFSLVEVVVAVVLLGLVTTAVLPFFLQSLTKGAALQHRQAAVGVANSALEQARSVSATQESLGPEASPVVVTALVRGRARSAVESQWAAAAEDQTSTTPRWDPLPGPALPNSRSQVAGDAAVVPLERTDTVSSVTYTSQTLIGTCRRPRSNPAAACTATGSGAAPTDVEMARIIVITRWSPLGSGECPLGGCVYRLTSLVDPSPDPQWLIGAGRVRPDGTSGEVTVKPGQTVTADVLANDSVILDGNPRPVTLQGTVPAGARTDVTGRVLYTAPASATPGSTVVVAYSVRNSAGSQTSQTTLTITVVS